MIISHKHKFIFIHIQKCAGTSITYALVPYLGEQDVVLGCTREGEKLSNIWGKTKGLHKHSTAREAKKVLGDKIWDSYFKFSFIRNPWDMTVSTYYWWLKTKWDDEQKTGEKIRSLDNFTEYVKSPYLRKRTCSGHIMDGKGNKLVDFLGRHESIEKDFAYICGRLNLPNIKLPVKNTSNHTKYIDQYTKETKQIVQNRFKWDIRNFKYSFQ